MILTKIGVLSLAKIQGIIMALFGLVLGLFMGAVGTMAGSIGMGSRFGAFGFLAVIILPIVYGILGFVMGAVTALVYNLISGWIGGVEMEFETKKTKKL